VDPLALVPRQTSYMHQSKVLLCTLCMYQSKNNGTCAFIFELALIICKQNRS